MRDENASKKVAAIGSPAIGGLLAMLDRGMSAANIRNIFNLESLKMPTLFETAPGPGSMRGGGGGFKQNQRKQRATSRRRAMKMSAR